MSMAVTITASGSHNDRFGKQAGCIIIKLRTSQKKRLIKANCFAAMSLSLYVSLFFYYSADNLYFFSYAVYALMNWGVLSAFNVSR